MSVHTEFGRSPAAELSDRPEETLIIDCADRAEEPPALKKRKSGVLTKPNDSAAKGVQFIPAVPNLSTPGYGSTTSCHPVLIATSGVYMRSVPKGRRYNVDFSC